MDKTVGLVPPRAFVGVVKPGSVDNPPGVPGREGCALWAYNLTHREVEAPGAVDGDVDDLGHLVFVARETRFSDEHTRQGVEILLPRRLVDDAHGFRSRPRREQQSERQTSAYPPTIHWDIVALMAQSWKLGLAVGVGALLFLGVGTAAARAPRSLYVYGGDPRRSDVDRDPQKLLPGFADKLNRLFIRMRARGFQPYLWEGYRSPQRAAELAAKGTGIRFSMHTLGAAGDIVDANALWGASPAFWRALCQEADRLGLTWGGAWISSDRPHVQALTVSDQVAFRAMTPTQQAQFVA